jgi:hypothetical protein
MGASACPTNPEFIDPAPRPPVSVEQSCHFAEERTGSGFCWVLVCCLGRRTRGTGRRMHLEAPACRTDASGWAPPSPWSGLGPPNSAFWWQRQTGRS